MRVEDPDCGCCGSKWVCDNCAGTLQVCWGNSRKAVSQLFLQASEAPAALSEVEVGQEITQRPRLLHIPLKRKLKHTFTSGNLHGTIVIHDILSQMLSQKWGWVRR